MKLLKKIWNSFGPGLITGASDDEPSAIATYSIAGAKFGYSMLWACIFTLPLMIAVQEMSARIGRLSNLGLAGNIKKHYPRWLLILIAILIVSVNTINVGADMAGMAQAVTLVTPFNEKISAVAITFAILLLTILLPYKKIVTIFKWVALSLLSYVFASFTVNQDWPRILYHTLIPHPTFSKDYFLVLIAFFGTTISPYLFFWQANQEAEERVIEQCKPGRICRLKPVTSGELKSMKIDTRVGMIFSNLITFFIITLTASTLFRAGNLHIETLYDAAEALRPLAGNYAYLLFTVGIISSGFLAIPVLAGSAAYVIAEVSGWSEGLDRSFKKAKEFYCVLVASACIGLLIPLLGIHPVRALFFTSILYGIISPILIYIVIHMANNRRIVGRHINSRRANIAGYVTLAIMAFFSVFVFFVL